MCELRVEVQVYVVRGLSHREARELCLRALVNDLVASSASRLCLERDASVEAADRRLIRNALARHQSLETITYHHANPAEQPVLWISDAVAWCQQAGGEWPRRAGPIVTGVKALV